MNLFSCNCRSRQATANDGNRAKPSDTGTRASSVYTRIVSRASLWRIIVIATRIVSELQNIQRAISTLLSKRSS